MATKWPLQETGCPDFGRLWTPNRWHQVNFSATPVFETERAPLAETVSYESRSQDQALEVWPVGGGNAKTLWVLKIRIRSVLGANPEPSAHFQTICRQCIRHPLFIIIMTIMTITIISIYHLCGDILCHSRNFFNDIQHGKEKLHWRKNFLQIWFKIDF